MQACHALHCNVSIGSVLQSQMTLLNSNALPSLTLLTMFVTHFSSVDSDQSKRYAIVHRNHLVARTWRAESVYRYYSMGSIEAGTSAWSLRCGINAGSSTVT